ncbi:MAG: OmpH family outer membrane protein [Prevotella sp.]|nr:OmpH family outer membrane protein [Prevotella sp.]MBQ9670411.1 OmpH family outer membrane protein [Prevotella sp.]MBR1525455.1 OmpH family outer membrane protein [Prevotella sp.]MDY6230557.1 OmpH family outer membrane protein [Prevotella sp.]MDY6408945.1 OmpH family outer membrane protein [Prevotella sp.]
MKKVILMLMLFAPLSIFAQKFGHIDSQALISSLPEAIRVQGELEALGKQYEAELTSMQNELQRKAEEYEKTRSTMNATKQAETEQSLQEMYNKIQQAASDNQQAFNKAQQEKLGPILDRVRVAIENVAKKGGYIYIMEQSAGQPIYVNTTLSTDITSEVKAELSK